MSGPPDNITAAIGALEAAGVSPAEFAARVTEMRLDAAVDRLSATGSPGYEQIASAARDLGVPVAALQAGLIGTLGDAGLTAEPFTETELSAARLSPPAIVETYLYRDLAIKAAPGGSNKTTLNVWEVIHIGLGLPLYGLRTEPCAVVISRARMAANA